MNPTRPKEASLVDLVDRLLDKGLVLQADLIISMGEVPLIGINLRAIIAGVETMLEYGMMSGMIQAAGECGEETKKKRVVDSHGLARENLPSEQSEREGEAPTALPLEGAT